MKKLFRCKLLSMLLALTLLFAGAVSLKPTQKANADETVYTDMEIRNFTLQSCRDIEITNDDNARHLCIIVDQSLFHTNTQNFTIDNNTSIVEINDATIMQTLAEILTDTVDAPPDEAYLNENGKYNLEAICGEINMDLLIHRTGFGYRNVTTNENVGLENSSHLTSRTNTTYNSIVYGLIKTAPNPSAMHILFTRIQQNNNFYMTSFHAINGTNTTGAHYTLHPDLIFGV